MNTIQKATWGHLIPEKINLYDWMLPEIEALFGGQDGL